MARKVKQYDIKEIREFTLKSKSENWLPSISGEETFTLDGTNPIIGGSSKGEINILTDFAQKDPEDINLKRYTLALYCLRHLPYNFPSVSESIEYTSSNTLMQKKLQEYLIEIQTGNGVPPYSRSLTSDIVRTYRGSKLKDPLDNEKSTQALINYSRSSEDYKKNVAGVLGKVSYDSIVKNTLYSLLVSNGLIGDYQSGAAESWYNNANLLSSGDYGFFVDVSGGPYKRAFPVICAYTKDKSGKKLNDILPNSNNLIKSKFSRDVGSEQLVKIINVGGEKNFIEYPLRDTGYSAYCVIYDLIKILILPIVEGKSLTIDLLKIGLDLLSRNSTLRLSNSEELKKSISNIKGVLSSSINQFEKLNFTMAFPNKHAEECSYLLSGDKEKYALRFNNATKVELEKILDSLEKSYDYIINLFDTQTKKGPQQNFQFKTYPDDKPLQVIFHFDNFYNLLAITSINNNPTSPEKIKYEEYPFDLEQYREEYKYGDLVNKFFADTKLPTFANSEYKFSCSIAENHDIALVTDAFIKQLYDILDANSLGIVYENDKNQDNDTALKSKSFELLSLINKRTGVFLNKDDFFYISSGIPNLRYDAVKKLSIKDLSLLFDGFQVDKIKFQTISKLLFAPITVGITISDFASDVHYPKLKETISATGIKIDKEPELPELPSAVPDRNNDYLINNIVSSELKCYEDIANNFQSALNAKTLQGKVSSAALALVHIGLPILLAYASKKIADELSEISKKAIDPSLLNCLLSDSGNLKKMILGFLDLATTQNPEDYLLQSIAQLPEIPAIPYFPVFDLEKEIKRRILEFIIEQIIKLLKESLEIALQPVIDMCNADSYLTSFLSSAIPNLPTATTPAGLPAGNLTTTYVPSVVVNINSLIEETGVETRENVYEVVRTTFFVDIAEYPNQEISDFFDYLSDKIDAGEMLTLLKGSSTPQTRNLVLGYIENYYLDKFKKIISDEESVSFLFVLLSQYINYTIIMEILSNSSSRATPSVCVDVNSRFDEYSSKYPVDVLEDQARELENSLNDICSLKKPLKIDILSGGPSLLTKGLKSAINASIKSIYGVKVPSAEKKSKGKVSEIYQTRFIKRHTPFKTKSSFVLKEMFELGLTSAMMQDKLLTDKNGKDFWGAGDYDGNRFYTLIGVESYSPNEKTFNLELPAELSNLSAANLNEFLSPILWTGEQIGIPKQNAVYSSPPAYDDYYAKTRDNKKTNGLFYYPYLNLSLFNEGNGIKISEKAQKIWKTSIKGPLTKADTDLLNLFYNTSTNPYFYLYINAKYTKSFIDKILDTEGVLYEEDVEFIKSSLQILQNNPSLEEYFKFALKLYLKAIEIEASASIEEFQKIEQEIGPWYELSTEDLSKLEHKVKKDPNEFNRKINNAGNIGLKTEESSLFGYIRKYELLRGTKTQIHPSEAPGALGDGIIINFVEEE